ncbi:hypothetical protein ETAA8_04820 [Anatilimnocola aggregata]|uniref:Uncharacterized protein n=1 Tax=Anatilimnocola aggregata TaxID=2528021 RepID=A0A517Y594_9BACT|nr:hypothetical protein [Anatilimnocola aggregata]QDU25414.1 hypothetical protein ETAA8_04820 [Anatilimnocola aggregata]
MDATGLGAVGGGAVLGMVIGWFLSQWRTATEIAKLTAETAKLSTEATKLRADIIKNESELISNLARARKESNSAYVECGKCLDALVSVYKANASDAELDKVRDSFCRVLTDSAIPRFLDHMELRHQERKTDANPDDLVRILDDTLDEFCRFIRWVTAINHPKFTRDRKLATLKISRHNFYPIEVMVNKFPDLIRNAQNRRLKEGLDKLCE